MTKILGKCLVCGKTTEAANKPFCSLRCANIDLGRWFNEKYVVPTDELSDEDITEA